MLLDEFLLILVVVIELIRHAALVPTGIELEHGFAFLLLLLFHLLFHLLLDVINDLQLRVLADDERLRCLDLRRHLYLRQERLLDVRPHLLHQMIELVRRSVRLFLFVVARLEGGILGSGFLILLLLLGAATGPALVLALLPVRVDIVIELLIVVVIITVVTSSFTLHLFNYFEMI